MAQAKPIVVREALAVERFARKQAVVDSLNHPELDGVADAATFGHQRSVGVRFAALLIAVASGVGAAELLPMTANNLVALLCVLAFSGGLLSTWSPCGYSSLSTLRIDPQQDAAAVIRWMPTLLAHALGYFAGGVLLAVGLGAIAWLLPVPGFTPWAVAGLAGVAFLYGLHQLRIIKMPYPQLRLQVSHGARMGLPKWATGLLYGTHLGVNFATYVRSPILYIVALACVLSGSLMTTLALVFSLNLGRFLPLLANLLPVPDWRIQRWMSDHDSSAVIFDGCLLVCVGTFLLAVVVPTIL